jgi:hypothetical protein
MNLKNYLSASFCLLICVFSLPAQVIFSEDFSNGFPAGWTNVDMASLPEEQVLFQHATNPNAVAPAALGDPDRSTFFAPGASNGFIWANSDRGLTDAPANIHITELTTPAINCSSEEQVFFSMYALVGTFFFDAEDNAILRVSTNNVNWTEYTIFPNLTVEERWSANPYYVAVNISEIAANEPTVYVQIQWTGGWEYFMAIDDFVLSRDDPRPPANMRINDFAAISPNVWQPVTQVEPIGFIADIENVGSEEQTNVELTVEVTEGTSSTVFIDQLDYGDMIPDQLTENVLFENQFDVPVSLGNYLATYTLTYDNVDQQNDPGLLSYSFPIVVTDTIFAKENGVTRGVDPAEDNEYSYGCVYYINNDNVGGTPLFASSITFGVTNADEIAGEFANILLLEWDGDLNGNFEAEQTEYSVVGINSYQFTGDEDLNLISVTADEDGPVPLTAGKYYIAAIQFATENPNQRYLLQASEDYDYLAMQFYTDTLEKQRWAGALDISNEGSFSLLGFGFDIVPLVRLGITLGPVATQEPLLPDGAVHLFPNPANEYANVSFNLAEETEGQLFLYDTKGALVNTLQLRSIHQNQIRLDTKNLPSGFYNIRLVTPIGVSHLSLSVQH